MSDAVLIAGVILCHTFVALFTFTLYPWYNPKRSTFGGKLGLCSSYGIGSASLSNYSGNGTLAALFIAGVAKFA